MHVYEREIVPGVADSLEKIAALVPRNSVILDLGMGTGALGRFLGHHKNVLADGVTLSPAEAERGGESYRKIVVADLDVAHLPSLFPGQRYDFVVCADVFEHLREPGRLLDNLPELLAPGGSVLASIPNVAYAGVLAELLAGDFRYRPEGLLDQTHLRFFTLASLQRWMAEHGWRLDHLQRVRRALSDSEFRVRWETLPPAVASYLGSGPEADVYQYVLQASPESSPALHPPVPQALSDGPGRQTADFVVQLYWARAGVFDEQQKIVQRGQIGSADQTLVFDLSAATTENLSGLRLDLSDRTGYLHLWQLELQDAQGQVVWSWDARNPEHQIQALSWPSHHLLLRAGHPLDGGMLALVHGDDPYIDLPLETTHVHRLHPHGGRLHLRLGWPMSADYLALVPAVAAQAASHHQECQRLRDHAQTLGHELEHYRQQQHSLQNALQLAQQERQRQAEDLRQLQDRHLQLQAHAQMLENLRVVRYTRPLVRAKNRIQQLLRPAAALGAPPDMLSRVSAALPRPPAPGVDIIVPVYKGLADTQACLQALVACPYAVPVRLIILNDASPEPELVQWLRDFAERPHPLPVVLLHNEHNLGFVGTVNKGMLQSDQADVVLVNSDALPAHNWLDRLHAAVYRHPATATATPFSNNATICSYPRFCADNALPPGETVASLDALCAHHLAGQTVDIPTAHGFCMYIRRAALDDVGLFDQQNFGKGYGEENDFCVRASQAGWRHVHALDVFVQHAGGVSFGPGKSLLESRAMDTLRRLHPSYEAAVHAFIAADLAAPARRLLDLARLCQPGRPIVLNITHNRGGGTLRHQHELAALLSDHARFLQLRPAPEGLELSWCGPHEAPPILIGLPAQADSLLDFLRSLPIALIHYHHLLDHSDWVWQLPQQLGVPYDFTAHDYSAYCPQISLTDAQGRYCGERGLSQCQACVAQNPAPGGMDLDTWRQRYASLLEGARHVLCPTPGVARRLAAHFPQARTLVCPHPDLAPDRWLPVQAPHADAARPLRVLVLGALSPIKGADVLERTARLATQTKAPLHFDLLGYGYRSLSGGAQMKVHGPYDDADLPRLLAELAPDVAWFPSLWPETYAYTLSACLQAGLPVVASDLGAFTDRLMGRPLTWLYPWDSSPQQWLQHLLQLRQQLVNTPRPEPAAAAAKAALAWAHQPSWSYAGDYLAGLTAAPPLGGADAQAADADGETQPLAPPAQTPLAVSASLLQALAQNQPQPARTRQRLVQVLHILRRAPGLSWIARRIPSHLQRRIKSRLLGA